MKPDWKDAPEWARWLAMDESGDWYWYAERPFSERGNWHAGGKNELAASAKYFGDTLEERPQ